MVLLGTIAMEFLSKIEVLESPQIEQKKSGKFYEYILTQEDRKLRFLSIKPNLFANSKKIYFIGKKDKILLFKDEKEDNFKEARLRTTLKLMLYLITLGVFVYFCLKSSFALQDSAFLGIFAFGFCFEVLRFYFLKKAIQALCEIS